MSGEPPTTTTAELNATAETPMSDTTTQLDNILSSPLSVVVIVVPVVILLITLLVGCLIWWRKRKRRRAQSAAPSAVAGSAVLNRSAAHTSVQSGPISVPNPAFSVRPQYDVAPPEQNNNNNNSAVFRQAPNLNNNNNNINHNLRPMSGQFTPVALQRPLSGQMQPFNARSLAQSAPVAASPAAAAAAPTRRGPLKYTGLAPESTVAAEPRYTAVGAENEAEDDNDVAVALAYSSGGLAPIGYSVLPPDQAAPAAVNYTSLPITQQHQRQY